MVERPVLDVLERHGVNVPSEEAAGGCVRDAFGRPFTFEPDLRLRWSGVFAATPELADELVELIGLAAIQPA